MRDKHRLYSIVSLLLISSISSALTASEFYIGVSAATTSIESNTETGQFLPQISAVPVPGTGFLPTGPGLTSIPGNGNLTLGEPLVFIPPTIESDSRETGYEILIGYHVFENLDVEIGYADLGTYSSSAQFTGASIVAPSFTNLNFILPDLSVEQAALRARYHRGISDRLSWFGTAGLISTDVEANFKSNLQNVGFTGQPNLFSNFGGSSRESGLQLGAGLAYKLKQDMSLNLNVRWSETGTVDLASALLTFEYDL